MLKRSVAMKFILGGGIVALMLTFLPLNGSCALRSAPMSKEFVAWQKEREKKSLSSGLLAKPILETPSPSSGRGLGLRPHPFDYTYLSGIESTQVTRGVVSKKNLASAPSSYDLRVLGFVTPVRNQNPYGTCWAHAALESLESFLLKTQGVVYDFSVNNLVNLCGFTFELMNESGQPCPWDGKNEGGNNTMAMAYLLRWAGPVAENDDSYPHPGRSVAHVSQDHVTGIKWVPMKESALDNDKIKAAVQKYGALTVTYHHGDDYLSFDGKSYCCPVVSRNNHAVAIVGWDDSYPRGKFRKIPAGDGAYIVKNSWGTSFGENGYFYVSYYDVTMCRQGTGMVLTDVDTAGLYSRVYQHDELGQITSLGMSSETAYAANIFTSQAKGELSAVGFYALVPNTQYEIAVRTDVSASNPGTGQEELSMSGSVEDAGFVTIPLTHSVSVETGVRFAVLLKLTTPGFDYPIPIECKVRGYSESARASGLSFDSPDGVRWEKISSLSCGDADACIKVYAHDASLIQKSEQPTSFAAAVSSDGCSVNLTWKHPGSDVAFKVYRSETRQRPNEPLAEVTGCSYRDETVESGRTYHYWVTAKRANSGFCESDSASASVTMPSAPAQIVFAKGNDWWPSELYLATAPSSSVATTSFGTGKAIYFNLGWKNASLSAAPEFKVAVDLRAAGGATSLGGWVYDSPAALGGGQIRFYGDYHWESLSGLREGAYELTVTLDPEGRLNGPLRRTVSFRMVKPEGALPDLTFQCYDGWELPFFITDAEGSAKPKASICSTSKVYVGCGVCNTGTDLVAIPYDVTFTLINGLGGVVWSWTYANSSELAVRSRYRWNANIGCRWNGLPTYPELDGLPPGEYAMRVELDASDAIQELNEENNIALYPFIVTPTRSLSDIVASEQILFRSGGESEWCGWSSADRDDVLCSGFLPVGGTNWVEIVVDGASKISFYQASGGGADSCALYFKDGIPLSGQEKIGKRPERWSWTFDGAGRHVLRIEYVSQSSSAALLLGGFSYEKARTVHYEPGPYGAGLPWLETKAVGEEMQIKSPLFHRAGYYQFGWTTSSGVAYEPTSVYGSEDDVTLYPLWAEESSLPKAVSDGKMSFLSSGDAPWIVQSSVVHDGDAALVSGSLERSSSGWYVPESILGTRVDGPGQVSFWWREHDPAGHDGDFSLHVDGKRVYSGSDYSTAPNVVRSSPDPQGWVCVTCMIDGDSSHKIEWHYERSFSNGKEIPRCYLDGIIWTPDSGDGDPDFEYEVSFGEFITILGYRGTERNVVIPSEIEGLPVRRIDRLRPDEAETFDVDSVTLPNSLEVIAQFAFSGCDTLTSIRIPGSVNYIQDPYLAFVGCSALTEIEVASENAEYKSENGCLLSKDGETFLLSPPGLSSVDIPAGVKIVGDNAFSDGRVVSVDIPEGVEEVRPFAFAGAADLIDVSIPATVRKIGKYAFSDAPSLKAVWFRGNAPECGESLYKNTAESLVTHVKGGSTGWLEADSSKLPDLWPVGEEFARRIVCDDQTPEVQSMSISGAGWHEVSFNVLSEGGKPEDVFAPVEDKIGYVTFGSENWNPLTGGTLAALEIGKGYWVQTTADDVSWTVTGQPNPDVEIALKAGWNLIGYPLLEEGEIETVLATALATGNIRYIYSGSRVYPGTLTTMAPGKGYWVYAEAAETIRFDFNE